MKNHLRQLPEAYPVILLILLALWLRLPTIGTADLWYDEAISYLAAQMSPGEILTNAVRSSHPPLYYLLLHFWLDLWPDNDGLGRLLSLFWNLPLIPILYITGKRLLGNRRAALVAAAFVVVSPFHIAYSQQLRMYTQLMFLVILAVFAYLRLYRQGGRRWLALFIVSAIAAVYTHLFAFLALLAVGVHTLMQPAKRKLFWQMAAAGAVVLVSFLPWLYILLTEANAAAGSLRPLSGDADLFPFTPFKLLLTFYELLFTLPRSYPILALSLFLLLSCFVFFILQLRRVDRLERRKRLLLPILLALATIGIPNLVYLIHPFFLPTRSMAAASPFLFLLLGWASGQRRTPLPALVYISLLATLAISIYSQYEAAQQPLYSAAVAYIEENAAPGDVVAHTGDFSFLPSLRYAQSVPHVRLQDSPERFKEDVVYEKMGGQVAALDDLLATQRRLWLVYAPYFFVEWQREQVESLAQRYPDLTYQNYNNVQLILFDLEAE